MESSDIYKYPGEDVLINMFDCHDAEELASKLMILSEDDIDDDLSSKTFGR